MLEQAQEAADQGEWSRFIQIAGGIELPRKSLFLQLAKEEVEETGKYGDPRGPITIGVQAAEAMVRTRLHQWNVMRDSESMLRIGRGSAPARAHAQPPRC